VATVQTLLGLPTAELNAIGRRFGLVVADECHHLPAATFRSVLAGLPGKYRFGLTATPTRADGLTPLLDLCIGPQLYRVTHEELVAAGHLVVPEVVAVETGCACEAADHTALVAALVDDAARNRLLVDLAAREAQQGHAVLVLSGRIAHCRLLTDLLANEGVRACALTGSVPRAKRSEILRRFREREVQVLCATTLADEGLDVPLLSRLVLATPARAEGRTIQRIGRLMRPYPGKPKPILYDLVDDSPIARSQHTARRRAYRRVLEGLAAPTHGCDHGG
jgi:superfamily II DNA or RNA helicase